MRSFTFALLCSFVSFGCHDDEVRYTPAPPGLIEVDLDGNGYRLSFMLPDAWRRVQPDGPPRGFFFTDGRRHLHVTIHLKADRFEAALAAARATDAEILAFQPGTGWPYVGVVVAYRGPPDEAMLETFKRSFKVERR